MIASHNSWTFAKPKKWWMRIIAFTARCQNINIQEQYKLGVRLFDLRIKNNKVYHGLIEYDIDFYKDLFWLNGKKDVSIRVLLESSKEGYEENFITIINTLIQIYPDIKFYGGQRKFDWKKIVNLPDFSGVDRYSSTTTLFPKLKGKFWEICDDLFPWIYSYVTKSKRKEWKELYKDIWLMLDFVEM